MAYGDGDRGVGGWLAFFLVTLGIFTPGASIILTLISLRDPEVASASAIYPSLVPASIAMTVALTAACWFACWRFLKVFNRQTVRIGIATLVFVGAMAVVIEPLVISAVMGLDFGTVVALNGAEGFRPVVYCTVWTLYLLLSKRVQNTYSGTGSEEEMSEVFR
jgi:hypothetical protein